LWISFETAASHRSRLIQKADARNMAQLVVRAVKKGFVNILQ
jgi:hypothetical protein